LSGVYIKKLTEEGFKLTIDLKNAKHWKPVLFLKMRSEILKIIEMFKDGVLELNEYYLVE